MKVKVKLKFTLEQAMKPQRGRSGRVRNISTPPGFDPWTVQPVESRCTDWAIPDPVN